MSIPKLCLMAVAFIAATCSAEELAHPKVEASTNLPVNEWGILDFSMGLVSGLYRPLQARANAYDCQAQIISEGFLLIGLNSNFNKPFTDKTWLQWTFWGVDVALHLYALYSIVATCSATL